MNAIFDGIILGAGHNALILQAYLSRCGLRTLSVDRAPIPGGGLMTIDNPRLPGFRHNPHSFFHRGVTAMPWYREDRKSTRLNSSHRCISYAVFCLKKKKKRYN